MKKLVTILLSVFILGSLQSHAQDNRTLETKIADILAQIPAGDLAYRNRLVSELFTLGDKGFAELAAMIIPPGTGDDAAARMAINSMARYASQEGKETEKIFLEKNLLTAIDAAREQAVKRFLIHQLNLVISDASIPVLQEYLTDETLCEPATQALLSLSTEQAAATLLEALKKTAPSANITLIKALGELHYRPAAPLLTQYVGNKDVSVQRVTLQALARIGDPASYETLWNVASNTAAYEPSMALSSFLTYLDKLGSEGELTLCKKGVDAMLKKCSDPALLHYRADAVNLFARYFGEKALPLLYKEAANPDKAYRDAVLVTAQKVGNISVSKKWFTLAVKASPEVKADIIRMLGRRGDPSVLPLIEKKKMMDDPDTGVREAVLFTYTALRGKQALPVLMEHLLAGKDIDYTQKLLLTLISQKELSYVADAAGKASGKALAACLQIIGERGGTEYFRMIYEHCSSEDPVVRQAAYNALPGTVTGDRLPEAIELLLAAQTDKELVPAQAAVVKALNESRDRQQAFSKLAEVMNGTDKKDRLIALLPAAGTPEALAMAEKLFFTGGGNIQAAAFRAITQWKDPSATYTLYRIVEKGIPEYRDKAFSAYVKMISSANFPDEQKLLKIRRIMPLARGGQEKSEAIMALGRLHIFPALVYTGKFLDDPEVSNEAARAVVSIALPTPDGKKGMTGTIVRDLLTKALPLIKGSESDYLRAQVQDYLEKMPQDTGFVSMFNGKDLSGWKGFVANPIKLSEMKPKELAKAQKEADKKMHENWSVNKNSIVFNGKGQNLVSAKNYGNFELWVDWRITKGGDSGIYLRGSPQVQIWDTSRRNVGAQVGSGGLYNNKRNRSTPLKVADNPIGEWNTFHIIMIDSIVTVWLNGELVVDHVPLENYWDRSIPIFPTGPIELQAHGSNLAFRDIYVREIPPTGYQLSEEEKAEGFVPLFNGKNLDGWVGNKTDYVVEDGMIVVRPKEGSHGNLYTEKEYKDFIYRFDFKLTPGANNGIGIRAPLEGDAAYVGMEIQVLDNTAPIYAHLKPYQYHGSVYGVIPAKRGYLKPVGEWNHEEIYVKGSHVKVTLNGHVILDGDIKEASKNGTLDHKDHPGLKNEKGHIGFLGHGDVVYFKNIRIKEL